MVGIDRSNRELLRLENRVTVKKMYMYIGLVIVAFLVLVVLCDFNVGAAAVMEAILLFGTASFVLSTAPKKAQTQTRLSLLDPRLQGRSNEQLARVAYAQLDSALTARLAGPCNHDFSSAEDQLRFG